MGLIYTVYIDSMSFALEVLVANLFTFQVPVAGGSQVRLTQSAASPTLQDQRLQQYPKNLEKPHVTVNLSGQDGKMYCPK